MAKVKFNQPSEFCAEMEKDDGDIDRKIVRTTMSYIVSKMSPNIHHVMVLGTYSVAGQLVEVEKYCGDIWRINQEQDDKVMARAKSYIAEIEETAKILNLEIRSGELQD